MTELTPHFVLNVVDRLASLVWASPRVSSEGKNEAGGPLGILGRDLDKCRHAAPLEGSTVSGRRVCCALELRTYNVIHVGKQRESLFS